MKNKSLMQLPVLFCWVHATVCSTSCLCINYHHFTITRWRQHTVLLLENMLDWVWQGKSIFLHSDPVRCSVQFSVLKSSQHTNTMTVTTLSQDVNINIADASMVLWMVVSSLDFFLIQIQMTAFCKRPMTERTHQKYICNFLLLISIKSVLFTCFLEIKSGLV